MSIELLELASEALGPLLDEVVGAATVALWITDPGAPPVRPTQDVDVVVEVATRGAFSDFEARLRKRRFAEDQEGGVICRWRHPLGLILDAMPSEPGILGLENRWQGAAIPHAIARELPDPRFADGLFGALRPDAASQARADLIVLPRLRALMP